MTNTPVYLAAALLLLVLNHANAHQARVLTFMRGDPAWKVNGDDEKTIAKVTCNEHYRGEFECKHYITYPDDDDAYDDDRVFQTHVTCKPRFLLGETCAAETIPVNLGVRDRIVLYFLLIVLVWGLNHLTKTALGWSSTCPGG